MFSKNSGPRSVLPIKRVSKSTREALDAALAKYHEKSFLEWDPLEFVHRFQNPWDQEVVALLGGVLAHGRVTQIRKNVLSVLDRMVELSESPSGYIREIDQRSAKDFNNWVHRFNGADDLFMFLRLIARSYREYGSVGAHFCSRLENSHAHIETALEGLIMDFRKWAHEDGHPVQKGFGFLLTAPSGQSTCKRWLMILRWLGRKDAVDVGLWMAESLLWGTAGYGQRKGAALESRQLLMPLDTHTGRIAQKFGLTHRKTLNWTAAVEVTNLLKTLDPDDPVKYDFALCKLGMLEGSK